MRYIPFLFVLASASFAASEPSVFGAGDLSNPAPYGLTKEEKLILENKKELQAVVQKSNAQNAKVATVAERLDGMQAIIEGLTQSSNQHQLALQKLSESVNDANASLSIEELKKQVSANNENITQMKALLESLTPVVDNINANYVTKEQFSALIKQLKITVPAVNNAAVVTPAAKKMDNAALFQMGNQLFEEKKYAEAQDYFEQSIQKKYKLPDSYFMIGESYFERKSYKEAVRYYKDSASRNEKAIYMPTLLLHTGMSMEKIGDVATAKSFYQATVSKFGGSGAAKEASERLSKLK